MDNFFEDGSDNQNIIRQEILRQRSTFLMNDVERARFMGLPEGCRIRENAKILRQDKLICGVHNWIGEGAIIDAQGGLEIGDGNHIGLYVMIFSHTAHLQALYGETGSSKSSIIYKATKIGSNCFIAGHSVIAAGVTIGNNVFISPMSFVDEDLPDGFVYSNNKKMKDMERKIKKLQGEIEMLKQK